MVTFYLLFTFYTVYLHCYYCLHYTLLFTFYLLFTYLLDYSYFHVEVGSIELTLGLHEAPGIILYLCPVILTLFLGPQGPNMVTPP